MNRRELWLWAAPVLILLLFFGVAKVKEGRAQVRAKEAHIRLQAEQKRWAKDKQAALNFVAALLKKVRKEHVQLQAKQHKIKAGTSQAREVQSELQLKASLLSQFKAAQLNLKATKMPLKNTPLPSGMSIN